MTDSNPAISVVMTAFNRERYIAAAIESVLAQTRGDFELAVWDDGSSDRTVEIARGYAARDRRVRVVAGEHVGQAELLCRGFAEARGRYVGAVDSDDLLAETALAETSAMLESDPSVGVCYTQYLTIDESGKVLGLGKKCQIPYSRDGLLLNFMTFQFRLIRRALYEQVGGIDPAAIYAEDYDLCLKLSEITQFRQIPRPLYKYRLHRSGISSQKRVEQILASQRAIAAALKRRGMDDEFSIEVEIVGKFYLQRKREPSR